MKSNPFQYLFILGLIVLGLLAACGGGGGSSELPPPSTSTCVWDSSDWDGGCHWGS